LEPATLAGVLEDHHYEQFFFDEPTCDALLALMARHERPLLLCTPSLAVAAERRGQRYLLLDRDERFGFLRSFRAFDLDSPSPLDEAFDAVFCDPPFANIDLLQLRAAIEVRVRVRVSTPDPGIRVRKTDPRGRVRNPNPTSYPYPCP
jgi:hypothetical protein